MAAIKIKLTRDEARTVDSFFDYWFLLCDSKAKHPMNVERDIMMWILLRSVLIHSRKKFLSRLNGFAQRFTFSFNDFEAITLIEFLKMQPIPLDQVWLCNLRQRIIDTLHPQI